MRIAQVAPLAESVPPKRYGGTERVVSYLTEELVRLGHDVTLFATADSQTSARLVPCAPRALRSEGVDPLPLQVLQLERVRARAREFDVLHFHGDILHLPVFRPLAARTVTTLHWRLDAPGVAPLYAEFAEMPLVAISNAQRGQLPRANWSATVHHGLARHVCPFNPMPRPGGEPYLAFLGRVSPEKGLDRAIEIARRSGLRLRVAAKVDRADEEFFHLRIVPLLERMNVEFLGEIEEADKPAFLGNAAALVFPIDWPEPFGLAMIEAMSCGTPVVAFRAGATSEVVEDGVTGYLVASVDEAVTAVRALGRLDRARVRARCEARFSAERMARDYLSVYRSLGRSRKVSGA